MNQHMIKDATQPKWRWKNEMWYDVAMMMMEAATKATTTETYEKKVEQQEVF